MHALPLSQNLQWKNGIKMIQRLQKKMSIEVKPFLGITDISKVILHLVLYLLTYIFSRKTLNLIHIYTCTQE
jgi:hypothetical protein